MIQPWLKPREPSCQTVGKIRGVTVLWSKPRSQEDLSIEPNRDNLSCWLSRRFCAYSESLISLLRSTKLNGKHNNLDLSTLS